MQRRTLSSTRDVGERPSQPGLENDADVLEPGEPQVAVETECGVGCMRVLHVDPDEVPAVRGIADDLRDVLSANALIVVEPERSELDRDVRIELLALDPGEDLVVGTGDFACFVDAPALLAEDVHRRHLPFAVQARDDPYGVLEGRSCDVTSREPPHDPFRHSRQGTDESAIEKAHGVRGSSLGRAVEKAPQARLLAHEALACSAHERDRLGEEHAHRIAHGECLLVGGAACLHLRQRCCRQLDRGVQGQRRELLALRLLHRLGLLLGELAQAA